MADKKKLSFKEFNAKNKSTTESVDYTKVNPAVNPDVSVPAGGGDVDDDKYPALFATIHHKSDKRPDGYTPKMLHDMNFAANRHLPGLVQPWRGNDEYEQAPSEDDKDLESSH